MNDHGFDISDMCMDWRQGLQTIIFNKNRQIQESLGYVGCYYG